MPNEERKQPDLEGMKGPGVESQAGIPELDELAKDYATKRDKRMAASKEEVPAKDALVAAVHKYQKSLPMDQKTRAVTYHNKEEKVFVQITPAKDKLKVRIGDDAAQEVEVEGEE